MKNKVWIPLGLTTLRLFLGSLALGMAYAHFAQWWYLPVLTIGLLSDIYDGVLARRLGVSTPALRRYDSLTDIVYYLCLVVSTGIVAPNLLGKHWGWIAAALGSEIICTVLGFVKFKRLASTHSYLAKFFGLALFAGLAAILGLGITTGILPALAIIGMMMNAEILLILLIATEPPVDVPSVFHLQRNRTAVAVSRVALVRS